MLEGQLSDPRINFGYVSEVVLAPGGKSARIYVAVDGDSKDEADMLAGLEAARGYIRHQLLQRMGVRHIPELFFRSTIPSRYEPGLTNCWVESNDAIDRKKNCSSKKTRKPPR